MRHKLLVTESIEGNRFHFRLLPPDQKGFLQSSRFQMPFCQGIKVSLEQCLHQFLFLCRAQKRMIVIITCLGKWMKLLTDDAMQHSSLSVQVPPSIPRMDTQVTGFALHGVIGEFLKEKIKSVSGSFESVLPRILTGFSLPPQFFAGLSSVKFLKE